MANPGFDDQHADDSAEHDTPRSDDVVADYLADDFPRGWLHLIGVIATGVGIVGLLVYRFVASQRPTQMFYALLGSLLVPPILNNLEIKDATGARMRPAFGAAVNRISKRVATVLYELYGLATVVAGCLIAWAYFEGLPPLDLRTIGLIIIALLAVLIYQNARRR